MSQRVFIDTSAYYTLLDKSATDHTQAQAAFKRMTSDQAELYITTIIVAEIHALVLIRLGRDLAARTLEGLYASSVRIIRPTERDETRAREIIRQQRDKAYSYADAISFAVMERLHLRHAWTYDHHFSQYG
ncbi:MAG: type II toxin-antitoxin system VapC family toxin, partial [Ktedonobacterales bacterium]